MVINGYTPNDSNVRSKVPQGTAVLGLLLFLLYVNDIGNNILSGLRLFADDCTCTVYRTINVTKINWNFKMI